MTDLENKNPNKNGIDSQNSTINNDVSKNLNDENVPSSSDNLNQNIPENWEEIAGQNDVLQNETVTENSAEMSWENNGIFLWKFENEAINTIGQTEENQTDTLSNSNPINFQIAPDTDTAQENNQETEKAKLAQKEKLIHLIKLHESKANKKWLTKGILIWVLCSIIVLALWVLFAKNQIITLLDDWNNHSQNDCISDITPSMDITENEETVTENEEVVAENEEAIAENEEVVAENEEAVTENEETVAENEEAVTENEEAVAENEEAVTENEETVAENEETVAENEETVTENEETVAENEETVAENNESNTSITHVDTPEEANWVLPAHCNDLTCYGEDKKFSPCTTFKLVENLDENANRIGNNGTCRYKDKSELVYVEL